MQTHEINILKEDDGREKEGYDIKGHINIHLVIKVLRDAGILLPCENVTDVYLSETGIGYYAEI